MLGLHSHANQTNHLIILMKFTDILDKIDTMVSQGAKPSDLKAYIVSARDQAEATEASHLALQKEHAELGEQHAALQMVQVAPVGSEVARTEFFPPITRQILEFFYVCTQPLTRDDVARKFGLQANDAQSHLDILYERKFTKIIRYRSIINGVENLAAFEIGKDGRAYRNANPS